MNKQDLYNLTRRNDFLWKSGGLLAVIMLVLGTGISFLNTNRLNTFQQIIATPIYVDEFDEEFSDMRGETGVDPGMIAAALVETLSSSEPFHEKLQDISFLLYYITPESVSQIPVIDKLSTNQQAIAVALVAACAEPESEDAIKALKMLASGDSPAADASYALALAHENREDNRAVIKALKREVELHDSVHARKRLIDTYLEFKKFDALEGLVRDFNYQEFISPYVLLDIALDRMDWPAILKTHFPASFEGMRLGMVSLAVLSGLVWATILIRFSGTVSVLKFVVPALLLGALSAHATVLFIYWQEYQLGFSMGADPMSQLIYCILGIGFREEALKLLLFVPLIPFLLKRDDLEILTVAGLVGLGFALEENINYFQASAGLSAVGRFATANFLHIALTAMCGLTLTRAIVHRGEDIQHAVTTFLLAVAVHGLYDAFLMVPLLADYSWLTYTVFVLMGYQYFGWLRHLREKWKDPVSITAIFTYGVILVTGMSFVLYAWDYGPLPALQSIVYEAIGVGIILVLFYREIPENTV
ncbi:MAG: PrsW family glutamic-type intramembrane protease [Pontiella sp.]